MKSSVISRIGQLEARSASRPWRTQEYLRSCHIANTLYERRRRLAEAAGEQFEDVPPQPGGGPRLSIAETLRRRREKLAKQPKDLSCAAGAAGTTTDIGN
jgi:hypothetical protein